MLLSVLDSRIDIVGMDTKCVSPYKLASLLRLSTCAANARTREREMINCPHAVAPDQEDCRQNRRGQSEQNAMQNVRHVARHLSARSCIACFAVCKRCSDAPYL